MRSHNHFWKLARRKAFSLLPQDLRYDAIRSQIKVPLKRASEMTYKLAETEAELSLAFRLLHDCYVAQGFMRPEANKMRIVPHFVLPSTATLVAKHKGEVVGTISIIKKSALQLPMEKEFPLDFIKSKTTEYAEISALAVKREFRRQQGGEVFLLMLKFMYQYCVEELNIRYLSIVIDPKDEDFYAAILFFKRIPGHEVVHYMNAPAISMYLDLDQALLDFKNTYNSLPQEKNLYSFFTEGSPELQFIERPYHLRSYSIVTPEIFSSLFLKRGQLFKKILYADFLALKRALRRTKLEKFFAMDQIHKVDEREQLRYEVEMYGHALVKGTKIPLTVFEASGTGFGAIAKEQIPIKVGQKIHLHLNLGKKADSKVTARVVWARPLRYGFKVVSADRSWEDFVHYIYHTRAKNYLLK